jgi:hypothetical protein
MATDSESGLKSTEVRPPRVSAGVKVSAAARQSDCADKSGVGRRTPIIRASFGFRIPELRHKTPAVLSGAEEVREHIKKGLTQIEEHRVRAQQRNWKSVCLEDVAIRELVVRRRENDLLRAASERGYHDELRENI